MAIDPELVLLAIVVGHGCVPFIVAINQEEEMVEMIRSVRDARVLSRFELNHNPNVDLRIDRMVTITFLSMPCFKPMEARGQSPKNR